MSPRTAVPAAHRARPFQYRDSVLRAGNIGLDQLATDFGTPLYVYDLDAIRRAWQEYDSAFSGVPHLICASVKANGNLSILRALHELGSGFDIVSGGELERVLRAGGEPERVVFSGVGKTQAEMDAALAAGVLLFNVESAPELDLLEQRAAALRVTARFGVRINPDVAADTHPHIATGLHRHKFGVEAEQGAALYAGARRSGALRAAGVSFHIGSQILDPAPFAEAAHRIRRFVGELRAAGDRIEFIDIGGGLGIAYRADQTPPGVAEYARAVKRAIGDLQCRILMEPGRRILAPAGALLTRVLYVKENAGKTFVITDAGHNDLIRPVLYNAFHEIVPVHPRAGTPQTVDIVGPICETADAFARDRRLLPVVAGDLLAILDAGAYGFSLASNYNSRPRAAEVLIDEGRARLIRPRETMDDLLACEQQCLRAQAVGHPRAALRE